MVHDRDNNDVYIVGTYKNPADLVMRMLMLMMLMMLMMMLTMIKMIMIMVISRKADLEW